MTTRQSSRLEIIGAGMAGLLAAQMLRRWNPMVRESQASLPNNHSALLRFRSDAVSRATGIPFQRVTVQKGIWWKDALHTVATIPMVNAYALKVTGEVAARSIAALRTEPVERFIAPLDFVSRLAEGLDICYDDAIDGSAFGIPEQDIGPSLISTIPMPTMMGLVSWPVEYAFTGLPIWTMTAKIAEPRTNVYQTIYYPEHEDLWRPYRVSLTGDIVTVESMSDNLERSGAMVMVQEILSEHFGLGIPVKVYPQDIHWSYQRYGKIMPIAEIPRRQFILALTDHYGVYSLGRFATWRQILLDDIVKDVEHIERFLTARDGYSRTLHWRTGQ